MFTGIITDIGTVRAAAPGGNSGGVLRLEIATGWDTATFELGESIAVSGPCLTVTEILADAFAVELSHETLARTTAGDWRPGTRVHLERALRVGDRLGGHFVTGHVDAVVTLRESRPDGDSVRWTVALPPGDLAALVSTKGSVALDGVSLTVNEVTADSFGVNLIPHTLQWTNFATCAAGTRLNFEVDPLARMVARLLETRA